MKHIKDEDDITKGCPNTHMRHPMIRETFERLAKEFHPDMDLHMKPDAPHYSSARTRIAYNSFKDNL